MRFADRLPGLRNGAVDSGMRPHEGFGPAMRRKPHLPGTRPAGAAAVRSSWRGLAAVLAVAGPAISGGAAHAGDFYLRAGIGLDSPAETVFADVDCSSTSPAPA